MTSQKELIPMVPGDLLRHEREKKGLTLARAAELSRVKLSVLSAIEHGETGDIPAVYLRGYIRNYAHFLGVDPNQLAPHMEHVKSSSPEVRSVFEVNTNRTGSERWFKATSYVAASALIATLAWQFTHEAVRFSQGESPLTSVTATSGQSAGGDAPASTESSQPAKRHLNASIASIEMLNQGGDSTAQQKLFSGQSGVRPSVGSVHGPHVLNIRTSADTWVEILDAEGEHLEMDLIRAGESREYHADSPLQILIGRASAVQLRMDGEEVDLAPHTRGNVARMTLGGSINAVAEQQTQDSKR